MHSSQKYLFKLIGFCLLASSCDKPTSNFGTVGNFYSVQIQEPIGIVLPSYAWSILSFPSESNLIYTDLFIRRGGKEMSFQPDVPGNYSFELIIFNEEGLSIVSNKYDFLISKSATASISIEPQPKIKTNTNEKDKTLKKDLNKNRIPNNISNIELNKKSNENLSKKEPKLKNKVPAKVKITPRADSIPSLGDRFTIQFYSESSLAQSKHRLDELIKLGFDAYIQKAYFQDKDELWYRVRVGTFNSKEEAKKAAIEIKRLSGLESWVDKVRIDQ
tara:strand:+ start:43285 stop:44106 length:822 start_codon:yes stop_codon:yes gene_type:complete